MPLRNSCPVRCGAPQHPDGRACGIGRNTAVGPVRSLSAAPRGRRPAGRGVKGSAIMILSRSEFLPDRYSRSGRSGRPRSPGRRSDTVVRRARSRPHEPITALLVCHVRSGRPVGPGDSLPGKQAPGPRLGVFGHMLTPHPDPFRCDGRNNGPVRTSTPTADVIWITSFAPVPRSAPSRRRGMRERTLRQATGTCRPARPLSIFRTGTSGAGRYGEALVNASSSVSGRLAATRTRDRDGRGRGG